MNLTLPPLLVMHQVVSGHRYCPLTTLQLYWIIGFFCAQNPSVFLVSRQGATRCARRAEAQPASTQVSCASSLLSDRPPKTTSPTARKLPGWLAPVGLPLPQAGRFPLSLSTTGEGPPRQHLIDLSLIPLPPRLVPVLVLLDFPHDCASCALICADLV